MKKFLLLLCAMPALLTAAESGYVYSLPLKFFLSYSDGSHKIYETWWTNSRKVETTTEQDKDWIIGRIEATKSSIFQIAPASTKIDSVQYNFNCIKVTHDMMGVFDANSVDRRSGTYVVDEKGTFVIKQQ